MSRKPVALANWKMAMTLAQTRAFVRAFWPRVQEIADRADIILCPPCTAIHTLSQLVAGLPLWVGAQDIYPEPGEAHTGAISAELVADAGARWVMVGHWEVRRRYQEDDARVRTKILRALVADLRPIVLIGEEAQAHDHTSALLRARLRRLFHGLSGDDVARMVIVYEPEWAIGRETPAPLDTVAAGCATIRAFIAETWDTSVAESVRIIYGGSVSPQNVPSLLRVPNIDGLGAGRKGRDPQAFAEIVRLVVESREQEGPSIPGSSG